MKHTYPKYIVPKPYLLEFVATQRFLRYKTNSKRFLEFFFRNGRQGSEH